MVVEAYESDQQRAEGMPRSLTEDTLIDETKKPQNLIDLDADSFVDFSTLPLLLGLRSSADIDLRERNSDIVKELKASVLTDAEYDHKFMDLHRRARYLEVGERAANGTVAAFFYILEQAKAGKRLGEIRESPTYSDHGTPHLRRVKMGVHLTTLLYPQLEYGGWKNFTSVSLFAPFHDIGQIPALLWNTENPEQKIKIKAGHAEEGGVTVDALQGVIAQQGNMTPEMAREVSGIASVMIFAHDIPERIAERLHGRIKANWRENGEHRVLTPAALMEAYKNGTLDLFTTSRSQRLYIMTQIKKEAGVLDKGGRRWGMHPEVEMAFREQLLEMEKDTTPLYWEISAAQRREIVQFALIAGISDMKDMMTPEHAHIRKFNVDASRRRGLYKTDGHSFDRITGKIGDATESDYERAMWEVLEFLRMTQKTALWKSEQTKERIINTVLDAYANTQDFYEELMKGEVGLMRIYKSYYERVQAIGLKALVKSKMKRDDVRIVVTESGKLSGVEPLREYFEKLFTGLTQESPKDMHPVVAEYERRYLHRVDAIRIESETAVLRIREKPDNDNGKAKTYSQEEFKNVKTDGIRVFEVLCVMTGMSQSEALERIKEIKKGGRKSLNVGSFDPIGRPKDIKTVKPIPAEILQLLDDMEAD